MNRFAYLAITILLPALATNAQSAKSDSIYNVARSLFEAGEYSNAIPMFEQVVELDMTEFPDDSDLNGISSHWLASCHYHLGDAGKAREYEPLYYELPPIDRGLTQSAREYSRMSNSATSIDMAIHWAQRCAEEEIKALGEDHYFVYGSWCNLAQLAFNKGDEMLCREYIGKASRIAENINTTEKAWKSLFLSIEADLEFSLGNMDRAEEIAGMTWDLVHDRIDILGLPYLRALNILLTANISRLDDTSANMLFGKAVSDYGALPDEGKENFQPLANLLAGYCINTSQTAAGLEICGIAMNYTEPDSEQKAEILFLRGQLNKQSGNTSTAIEDISTAISIYERLYPKDKHYLAQHYYTLGECYDDMRLFDKCEEAYNTALKSFRKQGSMATDGQIRALHHLGTVATRTFRFDKAISYIQECIRVMDKTGVGNLNDRAFFYREMASCETGLGNIDNSIAYLRKARGIYEENDLPLNEEIYFISSLDLCGLLIKNDKESSEAADILASLEEIFKEDNLYNRRMKIRLWQFQSNVNTAHGDFEKSLELLDRCMALLPDADYHDMNSSLFTSRILNLISLNRREEAMEQLSSLAKSNELQYGRVSRQYLSVLMLGGVFINNVGSLSELTEMNALGDEIIDIAHAVYRPDDPEQNMAIAMGAKMKALTHPDEAYHILHSIIRQMDEENLNKDPNSAMLIYSTLSDIKRNSGEYAKAVEYGEKCLRYGSTSDSNDARIGAYNTLAQAYLYNGYLAKAEETFHKALDLAMNSNNGINTSIISIYQSLSNLYSRMGRHSLAAEYQEKTNSLSATSLVENDIFSFFTLVNNLWPKYQRGLKEECLADMDRIEEGILNMSNAPNLDSSLPSRLRGMYWMYENDPDRAEEYADKALASNRNIDNLALRAQLAFNKNDLVTSARLTGEILEISEPVFGKDAFETVSAHKMLGDIRLLEGNATEATRHYRRAFDNSSKYIYDNLLSLTSDQRADFWASNHAFYRTYLPSMCLNFDAGAEMSGLMYDAMLFSNGLLLNVDKSILRTVHASGEDVKALYTEWNTKKDLLRRLSEHGGDTGDLNDDVVRLEKKLMGRLRETSGATERWSATTWQQVRKALPKGAAAVEFIDFPADTANHAGMALVLTRDMKYPRVCQLYTRRHDDNLQHPDLYDDTTTGDMIWGGIADAIGDSREIYFTPQGPLCSIAIESLPVSDGKLPAGVTMHRLSSTAELIYSRKKRGANGKGAILYGGLNYDTGIDTLRADADRYPELRHRGFVTGNLLTSRTIREGDITIPYLEGSRMEVDSISGLISRTLRRQPICLTGDYGTETSFKAYSGKYGRVLHISTHGFFDSGVDNDTADGALTIEDKALQRSGLLMAGAANKYAGMADIPDDLDDGILTAAEIADLDLSKVEIAVLSACETGLGQVTGDGVFGLQRGFKKAGAGSILMSLWKVDDDATCRLITEFYRHWLGDPATGLRPQSKHTALEMAKASVRTNPQWNDPYYWAAFILLDALD